MIWEGILKFVMYVKSDTILLADVSVNFQNTSLEIYEFNPAKFISAPGLAWQASLKNTKEKLDLLKSDPHLPKKLRYLFR